MVNLWCNIDSDLGHNEHHKTSLIIQLHTFEVGSYYRYL